MASCVGFNMSAKNIVNNLRKYALLNDLTFIDYIESTGTQYIVTDIIPDNNTRIVADFIQKTTSPLIRCINGTERYALTYFWQANSTEIYSQRGTSVLQNTTTGKILGQRVLVDFNNSASKIIVDGTICGTLTQSLTLPMPPLVLFATNNAGNIITKASAQKVSIQVYQGAILVGDFRPAVNNVNGRPLSVNIITGERHYNEGTGEFLFG